MYWFPVILLIKVLLLSYFKIQNNVNDPSKYGKFENKNINDLSVKNEKNDVKFNDKIDTINYNENSLSMSDEFVNRRINNCFVNASKLSLINVQKIWNNFIKDTDFAKLKGLISDTQVVTASDSYVILVTTINHQEIELNQNIEMIENNFNKFCSSEYRLVFLSEKKWNIEKKKYIENLQKKYKYEYISEQTSGNIDTEDEITSLANNLFSKDKIEIE